MMRRVRRAGVLTLLAGCAVSPPSWPDARSLDPGTSWASVWQPGAITVLVFVVPDCPIANQMVPELLALAREFGECGVAVRAVHVDPDATRSDLRAHAEDYGYAGSIDVLWDPDHRVAHAFGVRATPEAFVLGPAGEIRYRGQLNDLYVELGRRRAVAARRFVAEAVRAVLDGREVAIAATEPVGCLLPVLSDAGRRPDR